MADETMQGAANLTDGYDSGSEVEDDEDGKSSEYNPDEGKWGPDPFGIGENRTGQDPAQVPSARQYQGQQAADTGQTQEGAQSPLEQISPYLQENEYRWITSLPPQEQSYFVNALSRIDGVYKAKEQEVAEYGQQLEAMSERVQDMAFIEEALTPKLEGTQFESVGDYLSTLVEADMAFTENPTYAIINLMEHHGIKLDDLYQDAVVKFNKESDPYYQQAQAAKAEKEAYERQLAEVQATQAEQQEAESMQFFENEIAAFAAEEDGQGNYTHPFFSLVEGKMGELLQQQENYDLEDLYQQACWLDPAVREQMIAMGYGQGYAPQQQVDYAASAPANGFENLRQGPPNAANTVAKFATSNSPGDTRQIFGDNKDGFKEAFERNYARIHQRQY